MLTQRRNALVLAAVLAATTVTGGGLVTVLASQSAATPSRIHATTVVATHPPVAPAPVATPSQWHEPEGSES